MSLSLGIGIGLTSRRAGGPVAPSTSNFTYAQMSPSLTGQLKPNTPIGQTTLFANGATFYAGWWAGLITGTAASMQFLQYGTDQPGGMIRVSVDGAAFTSAPVVSGKYELFTGLPHATRRVLVHVNPGYGDSVSIPNSGNVMTVTGAPPSITAYNHVQPLDGDANVKSSNTPTPTPNTGFLPANVVLQGVVGANVPSVALRGNISEMLVTTRSRYVYVSAAGAAPTRYDGGVAEVLRCVQITGLSGLKTYNVWHGDSDGYPMMSVGTLGGALVAHGIAGTLDQYGDSITQGVAPSSGMGEVDMFGTAAALNRVGGNYGVAGNTIADLKNRMASCLTNKTITATDVAVIAIGRNNPGALFDAAAVADYQAIVNSLLATSYGRIICRGILPDGVNTWSTENGQISSIVSGFANAKVVFCDTSSWSGITTGGAVHPGDAGYAVARAYAIAAYPALIGAL